jgi:hypothetical protein
MPDLKPLSLQEVLTTLVTDILENGVHLATTHGETTADKFFCPKGNRAMFRPSLNHRTQLTTFTIYIYREPGKRFNLTPDNPAFVQDFVKESPDLLIEIGLLSHEFGHWASRVGSTPENDKYLKALSKKLRFYTWEDHYFTVNEEFTAWKHAIEYLKYRNAPIEVILHTEALAFNCLKSWYL